MSVQSEQYDKIVKIIDDTIAGISTLDDAARKIVDEFANHARLAAWEAREKTFHASLQAVMDYYGLCFVEHANEIETQKRRRRVAEAESAKLKRGRR